MIAAGSGVALLIFMLLPWYGVDVNVAGFSASESANAWETLSFIDILLFLVALVAVGVPLANAAGVLPPDVPGALLVFAAGAVGLLLVLYRIIDIPAPDVPSLAEDTVDFDREIGLFLALIATAAITYGGWRANAERPGGAAPGPPPAAPAT
jgi:hypothetical protein